MPQRTHHVVFISPGTLFPETTTKTIERWDPALAMQLAEGVVERYGATPSSFEFQTWLEVDPVPDGEGGTLEVKPKVIERSGFYFINGTLRRYHDVLRSNLEEDVILLGNMIGNRKWIVVETKNGYKVTNLFEEKDYVVNTRGIIIERGDAPHLVEYRALCEREVDR